MSKEEKQRKVLKQESCSHEWIKKSYHLKAKGGFSLISFLFGQAKDFEITDEGYVCLLCGKSEGFVEPIINFN